MITMTRKQYMEADGGTEAHRTYYSQFVTDEMKRRVLTFIGKDKVVESTDPHFNNIGLHRWDAIAQPCPCDVAKLLMEAGDYPTLAGLVCILKEAAQQIREEE